LRGEEEKEKGEKSGLANSKVEYRRRLIAPSMVIFLLWTRGKKARLWHSCSAKKGSQLRKKGRGTRTDGRTRNSHQEKYKKRKDCPPRHIRNIGKRLSNDSNPSTGKKREIRCGLE